jgi:nucleoside-diphosphate-sugar epimerase
MRWCIFANPTSRRIAHLIAGLIRTGVNESLLYRWGRTIRQFKQNDRERSVIVWSGSGARGAPPMRACVSSSIYWVSTILLNGASTDGWPPFREEDPATPRGVYGLSKAAAEAGLEAVAKETDMSITVIRPPLIYGPGALGNFRTLVRAAQRGIPLPFGSIHNRRAFLGVENLAW